MMIKIGKNLSEWSAYSCQPKTKKDLIEIINNKISKFGYECDLNDIDTSLITDMYDLFCGSEFNGNISKWDVSNVANMSFMFANTKFNQDISNWKINKDCDTSYIFLRCHIKEEYKPALLK